MLFFDIRITHPKADLQCTKEVQMQLLVNEREKKRKYAQRISSVNRDVFTPLVIATNGMVGRDCDIFLKFLAGKIVEKNIDLTHSAVINRLRCKFAFCLIRWCMTCLRDARTSYRRTANKNNFITECRLASS